MFVALEGIDGAGKGTQARLLEARASSAGVSTALVSFPRYGRTFFADSISTYLNGGFGPLESVPPQFAALLFAGDRFETSGEVRALQESTGLLIADRYVASNVAYQSSRLVDEEAKSSLVAWIGHVEYEVFKMPAADVTVLLDMPAGLAQEKVATKAARTYTEAIADLHERDASFLSACRETYLSLAARGYRGAWITVDCTDDGGHRSASDIHDEIWTRLGLERHPVPSSR